MIGTMTYEQVETIIKELENATTTISSTIKDKNIEELEDFVSTVEGYSKYLKTTLELNKDADKAFKKKALLYIHKF